MPQNSANRRTQMVQVALILHLIFFVEEVTDFEVPVIFALFECGLQIDRFHVVTVRDPCLVIVVCVPQKFSIDALRGAEVA